MIDLPEACSKAFEIVLKKLIKAIWRSNTAADELLEQYKCFLQFVKKDYEFEFMNCKDVFLFAHISDKKEFQPLWSVFKLLLTICRSQSMVERGFSVNNDVVTPNFRNETLVSLQTVYDDVNYMNIDLSIFMISKELLAHCRGARTRYEQHLAESKKEHHARKCARKRKAVLEEIKEQKVKKMKIKKKVEVFDKEADSIIRSRKERKFSDFVKG